MPVFAYTSEDSSGISMLKRSNLFPCILHLFYFLPYPGESGNGIWGRMDSRYRRDCLISIGKANLNVSTYYTSRYIWNYAQTHSFWTAFRITTFWYLYWRRFFHSNYLGLSGYYCHKKEEVAFPCHLELLHQTCLTLALRNCWVHLHTKEGKRLWIYYCLPGQISCTGMELILIGKLVDLALERQKKKSNEMLIRKKNDKSAENWEVWEKDVKVNSPRFYLV